VGVKEKGVPQQVQRWIEVTPSQFTHEAEGLTVIRILLPQSSPFRAWSNFEFRDGQGKWHEVDLLVLGRRRLHLVELKYYTGTLRGDDLTWRRDGHRAEDSPLKLARRKAQRLASKLQDELTHWAQETGFRVQDPRTIVPFAQECVFLHHPGLRCLLPMASRTDLFGLDGQQSRTGLPGISDRLLEAPTPQQSVGPNRDDIITALMARIGAVQRRQREAGSWVIDEDPLSEGEGWQDWPAFHRVATTDRARIRFLVTEPGASATQRARVRRVAEHEFRIMSRLPNERLLRPRDMVDNDLGVGLVYPIDERFHRLDLWLADQAGRLPLSDQLSLLRQVAEAVSYAHQNRVVHRGLTPHAVLVRSRTDSEIRVLVGDWQSAGAVSGAGTTGASEAGVTNLVGVPDGTGPRTDRGGDPFRLGAVDVDQRLAESFQAPEGVWRPDADRVRLDVFALGALGYYILAGRLPASDRTTVRERLRRDGGLDLAVDLPQVPPALRALILDATRPSVSDRLPDVRTFLERLDAAEQAVNGVAEDVIDPLEAAPGALIDGRFRLLRRLGTGSTAMGLLVTDTSIGESGADALRVLKVALNDAAAGRLADEAKVLSGLRHPRIVRLVEGPIVVGGRQALILESAGDETLGEVLRGRGRLSLDLLERWGADLLEALVALDRAGVDHRDIKPANLGVREGRSDRVKHLVLFDFSLSSAGATAVTAGTPPYLDPFLDTPQRGRYDSAAERYSAAVVLFEMATGTVPKFGDGLSDPASVSDEATIEPAMLDPAVAAPLTEFFKNALTRDARQRFDTAAEMLASWQAAFEPVPKTQPDDADQLAAAAQPTTPLAQAGLSARALSAVEPLGVITVGDLVAVDPVRLNHLSGVAEPTRREVKSRARQWRDRLSAVVLGRGVDQAGSGTGTRASASLPDPVAAAELLMEHAGTVQARARRLMASLVLGLASGADAFAAHGELGLATGVTRVRATQHLNALQEGWSANPGCRSLLDLLADVAWRALTDSGGVATVDELTSAILALLPSASRVPQSVSANRIAAGLVRLALDRVQELNKAEAGDFAFATRRRDGRIYLIAIDAELLDPAEALGRAADELIAQARGAAEPLVPAARAAERFHDVWGRAVAGSDPAPAPPDAGRLVRLAAELARDAALAGSGDLYPRDLPAVTAVTIALSGIGATQAITAQEVQDRVRAKFPLLSPLPERPRLDQLLEQAGLGLIFDESERAFRSPTRTMGSQGLASRVATSLTPLNRTLHADGPSGHRLTESATTRSFLAIGVDAAYADRAVAALLMQFGVVRVDVTHVLIETMKGQAEAVGLDWDIVRAADAAAPGTRDAEGLSVLVQRSLPAIDAAITAATAASPEGTRPVVLTEVAPLARYNHLNILGSWADLATRRAQAIWILVPQLAGNTGAIIDRRPLPLAAPGQFMRLDPAWINAHALTPAAAEGDQ
jgi:serine/threonine protein kinase